MIDASATQLPIGKYAYRTALTFHFGVAGDLRHFTTQFATSADTLSNGFGQY